MAVTSITIIVQDTSQLQLGGLRCRNFWFPVCSASLKQVESRLADDYQSREYYPVYSSLLSTLVTRLHCVPVVWYFFVL
jgi:hypothetical protein